MKRPIPLDVWLAQHNRGNDAPQPFETVTHRDFEAAEAPTREFLDERHIFPARNVAMLSGDGGVGKSLLALQLAIAVFGNVPWAGISMKKAGSVVYLAAEDDRTETHVRYNEILRAEGVRLADAEHALHIVCLAGHDATLAVENGKGRLQTTPIFNRLIATMEEHQPALLVLDNLADVFGGNEVSRVQAKQFVGFLRSLAIRFDCVVLLLSHPSLTGISTGIGASGSTGWSNSVRVRLYLRKGVAGDGSEPDDSIRLLEIMKSNYNARGQPIRLQWVDGRYVRRDADRPFDGVSVQHLEAVQAAFRDGHYRASDQARDWGGHVVASILNLDIGRFVGTRERTAEQNRNRTKVKQILAGWLQSKAILVVEGTDAKREPTTFFSVTGGKNGLL
jgi:RecA-family ATPase